MTTARRSLLATGSLAALTLAAACSDFPTLPNALRFGAPRTDAVPAVSPDGVSDDVLAASRDATHVITDQGIPGRVVRDRVWLRFRASASADERQAAVDAVHGTVLGGVRLGSGGDGVYYVALTVPDDSGAAPLLNALATLKAMPQVRRAFVDDLDGPSATWLLPKDGTSFATWKLHPDSATGLNWGAEAIAAPLAWGCATGLANGAPTGVGVVDAGFVAAEDLLPNVAPDTPPSGNAASDHGTRVASIIGAAGDNGAGMTGLLWRAQLGLFDLGDQSFGAPGPVWRAAYALRAAAHAGYRVINLSAGLDWQTRFGRLPNGSAGDSAKADAARYALEEILDDLRATETDNAPPPSARRARRGQRRRRRVLVRLRRGEARRRLRVADPRRRRDAQRDLVGRPALRFLRPRPAGGRRGARRAGRRAHRCGRRGA